MCAVHLRQINHKKIGIVHYSYVSSITKADAHHPRLAFVGGAALQWVRHWGESRAYHNEALGIKVLENAHTACT